MTPYPVHDEMRLTTRTKSHTCTAQGRTLHAMKGHTEFAFRNRVNKQELWEGRFVATRGGGDA